MPKQTISLGSLKGFHKYDDAKNAPLQLSESAATGNILSSDANGNFNPVTLSGSGLVTAPGGLTTNVLPKTLLGSALTLADSIITDDGSSLTIAGEVNVADYIRHTGDSDTHVLFTTNDVKIVAGASECINCSASAVIIGGAGQDVDFQVRNDSDALSFDVDAGTGNTTVANDLITSANVTLGAASVQTVICNARLTVRSVTDAGPMTSTAGTIREIVYNTSDTKFYGCTVTGSPATWVAMS